MAQSAKDRHTAGDIKDQGSKGPSTCRTVRLAQGRLRFILCEARARPE